VVAYFGTRDQIGDLPPGISVAAAATSSAASLADEARPYHAVHLDTAHLAPSELLAAQAFVRKWAHLFDVENYPRVRDFEVRVDLTGDHCRSTVFSSDPAT
jgi:hypothetical protein